MIKAGVCGFGGLGHIHANSLARVAGVQIQAVCDSRPEQLRARDIATNLAAGKTAFDIRTARTYPDYREMLEKEKLDVVVVALPTDLHADCAIRAMEAGAHVLTEKPMALNLEQCDRMIEARNRTGRHLMVAQCLRFWPEYQYLLDAVRARPYGRLLSLSMERIGGYSNWSAGGWMRNPARSGGMILDLHLHDVDWTLYALGKPRRLCAAGIEGKAGGMDDVTAVWCYEGTQVSIRGSWLGAGFAMTFRAYFEEAAIEFGVHPDPALRLVRNDGKPAEKLPVGPGSAYQAEVQYFIDCVRGERENTMCTPESTRESVAFVMRETEAIRKRIWLEIW